MAEILEGMIFPTSTKEIRKALREAGLDVMLMKEGPYYVFISRGKGPHICGKVGQSSVRRLNILPLSYWLDEARSFIWINLGR